MDLKGAFASFSDSAAGTAAKQAAGAALGSYGVPPELNPYAPPAENPTPVTGPTINSAKEDAQPAASGGGLGALWSRYRNLILIGVAVLLGGYLLIKRRK